MVVFSVEVKSVTENKTLIAYATKGGATEKIAKKLAEVLQANYGLQVDLANLQKQIAPNLNLYRNVVVGTGVRGGKIYDETKAFIGNNFAGKQLAYYTCSGFIYPKTYDEVVAAYTTNILAEYPSFKPSANEAFGGILKIIGIPVSRRIDMAKVEAWAVELGKKFSQ